ncbi:MAG: cache domain-containing protein [Leptolyngbyaceae cyanobacterium MO_188.B28]|nr:cache domain-containing protein [Leptolyngbyaceae cyanobacterium MO_188.B28]
MNFLRKSLLYKLVGAFSVLSLVTISLVTFIAYIRAKESLKDSIFERLNVAVSLKEFELNQWMGNQKREAILLASSPDIKNRTGRLFDSSKDEQKHQENTHFLFAYFSKIISIKPDIQDISILTNAGIVQLSTDESQVGTYQGLGNTITYFEPGQTKVVPNIYTSSLTGKSTITLATPITNEAGQRQAVLAITLNLKAVDRLIREKTGLGTTGETYLVKQLNGKNVFISGEGTEAASAETKNDSTNIKSKAIDTVMRGIDGSGLYLNYEGIPVIGVYHWLGENNLGLLAEIAQKEAFQPAVKLAGDIILIGFSTAGVLLVLIYCLAYQIAKPVLIITNAAAEIETGKFEPGRLESVKHRLDELGRLARVFQSMAKQVYVREQKLKRQVAELQIEIDQTKKARQVAEITETDYFQSLRQKAKQLRRHRNGT